MARTLAPLLLVALLVTLLVTACACPTPLWAGEKSGSLPALTSAPRSENGTNQKSVRLEQIKQRGKLVVATSLFPPFEFHEPGSTKLMGFDVDVAERIAADLGVTVEWREYQFAALMPAVQAGQVDAAIAAMYVTDARRQQVDFSRGYATTGLVLAVRKDNVQIRQIPEDLAGRTIAVKLGATGAKQVEEWKNQGIALTVQTYNETLDQLMAVYEGKVDVALNDRFSTMAFIKEHPDVRMVGEMLGATELAIAVRKGDVDLLQQIDQSIERMVNDRGIDSLLKKWFQ